MSNARFTPMFIEPPLLEVQYNGNLNSIKTYCKELKLNQVRGSSWISEDYHVLDSSRLKDLKHFILDAVHLYNREVLLSEHEIEITQSWTSHQYYGEEHAKHHHANSFLSGVFFVQTCEESPPLVFESLFNQYNFSIVPEAPSDGRSTKATSSSHGVRVNEGSLFIFSSNQPHFVPSNMVKHERISIAFNTYFKGTTRFVPMTYNPDISDRATYK
tara:strand:+ start:164 stop:808 length:645 start_codon:yes stop_codon:yes gene_type:complete